APHAHVGGDAPILPERRIAAAPLTLFRLEALGEATLPELGWNLNFAADEHGARICAEDRDDGRYPIHGHATVVVREGDQVALAELDTDVARAGYSTSVGAHVTKSGVEHD